MFRASSRPSSGATTTAVAASSLLSELSDSSDVGRGPTVKPEAVTAVVELLMMGVRLPETCCAVHKRQVLNLRSC
jgi:hypothetical protein